MAATDLPRETLELVAREARPLGPEAVGFCRDLVRIPSPSGREQRAAERTAEEMRAVGLEHVEIDRAGNAVGVLETHAAERLPGVVMLNAHLDHVDAGPADAWSHGPFEGKIAQGRLWGRGATDTKSAVASQVHAAGLLARLGREGALSWPRDIVVAAVVQEEVGGLGTASLLEDREPPVAAIVGEPSLGNLAFGHRGRVEVEVAFHGRAAHASRPDWGLNPHGSLARFVLRLEELERDEDVSLGRSSLAPTQVVASPSSVNVIPSRVKLTIDWRNVPGESPEAIRERIRKLATQCCDEGVTASVGTPEVALHSWRGAERRIERVSKAFVTDPESVLFADARRLLAEGIGREVKALAWDFASDGGWLHAAGTACLGYGPGQMNVMHALDESVSVELVEEAVSGNALLALLLAARAPAPAPSRATT